MRPLKLPALTRRAMLVSAAALPLLQAGPAAAAGNVAETFVDENIHKGLSILSDKKLTLTQRRDQFETLLLGLVDVRRIALFTLGQYRRSAPPEDVEAFVNAFKNYATAAYQSYFAKYTDQTGVELLPGPADLETACECDAWAQPCVHALALLYQLAWHLDGDPYALLLLRGRTREQLLDATPTPVDPALDDTAARATEILRLAGEAPAGHGLADTAVAAYDEAISRLL